MKKQAFLGKVGIGIASIALLAAIGCNRAESNLVVVNGEAITLDEFNDYLKVKPQVNVQVPSGERVNLPATNTLGFQALQDLIRQKVILQLAKDMAVEPTKEEIEKEVEFQRKRDPKFVTNLMEKGLSLDQIRNSIKVDLAREKLLTKGVTITDKDVDEYISSNPQQFTEPATVDALWIFVKDERRKRDVDRAFASGTAFSSVATRLSQADGAKDNGGRFANRQDGRMVVAALPQVIQEVLDDTPKGQESKWIAWDGGWAKFQINDRTAEKKIEIKDTDRIWIKRQLAVRQGMQANDLDKRLLEKLKDSKIDVSLRELKGPWEREMDQIGKAIEDQNKIKSPTDEASPTTGTGAASKSGTP